MLARRLAAVLAALVMLLVAVAPTFAATDAVEGQPTLSHDSATGYYLWHDEDGFHLRTHGPGPAHTFVARLHTDGIFTDIDSVQLEDGDVYAVLDGGHTLVIRFHTYNHIDGVNFRIRGGEWLRLRLELEGQLIPTSNIFLGADGRHPASNPFTLWR